MSTRVGLLGSSGFVGSAVADALRARGAEVVPIVAPRLSTPARGVDELVAAAAVHPARADLAAAMRGLDVVVNAAGDPDASSLRESELLGANALLPAVVATVAREVGVSRVVHVSSAVVQNDIAVLDESEAMRPFSPYSLSKVRGEEVVRAVDDTDLEVVRYRPPSVHAAGRRVTRMIARIARSPFATVARPGDQPTPQALLVNVGDAVALLATVAERPPAVVIHPSEGVTVTSLMSALSGGREPRRVPRALARLLVAAGKAAGRLHRPTAANARRLELLWLGQGQAVSWLTTIGWSPVVGPQGWIELGRASAADG